MRTITAYSRLLEALDMLCDSMARSMVHVGNGGGSQLARVNEWREALRAAPVDNPHAQIDDATLRSVLAIYEAASRARFFVGSESSLGEFQSATGDAEAAAGALYVTGGSESWGRFPPRR